MLDSIIKERLEKAKVSKAALALLETNEFDTEAVLRQATLSDLAEIEIPLADRIKIKGAFPASVIEVEKTDETGSSKVPSKYGQYAGLVDGSAGGVVGVSASALNPRINPSFVERAAELSAAYVLLGTGVVDIFDGDFFARFQIEDFSLRERIDEFIHNRDQGTFLSSSARAALIKETPSLFPPSLDDILTTAAKLSASIQALSLVGSQATVNVGAEAMAYSSLHSAIAFQAEFISDSMIGSRAPESTKRLLKLIKELLSILKEPLLQQYGGVFGAVTEDAGLIRFLQKQLEPGVVNYFRLALSYERFLKALALCPGEMEPAYLNAVGTLAGDLANLFAMVLPSKEKGLYPSPFTRLSELSNFGDKSSARNFIRLSGSYPSSGWPFSSHKRPVSSKAGVTLPFILGPTTEDLVGCQFQLVICAGMKFRGCEISDLVFLGDGSAASMQGGSVERLYCEFNQEPAMQGTQVSQTIYKSREELISMAQERASVYGVNLA